MSKVLIQLSASLIGGLLMSRLAKKLNLPASAAYTAEALAEETSKLTQ